MIKTLIFIIITLNLLFSVDTETVETTETTETTETAETTSESSNSSSSGNNKFYINKDTGTVTLIASPQTMREYKRVISDFNEKLTKKIYIKVSVYEVALNKENENGISWGWFDSRNIMKYGLGNMSPMHGALIGLNETKNSIAINTATKALAELTSGGTFEDAIAINEGLASTVFPSNDELIGSMIPRTNDSSTIFSFRQKFGTNASMDGFVKMLNTLGKVTNIQSFNLTTLNNIGVSQSIKTKQNYIKSMVADQSGTDTTSATITVTPTVAEFEEGFDIFVQARYNENNNLISLKVNPKITKLISIDKRTYGPANLEQYIQTPVLTTQELPSNIIVQNGEKVIIAGIITDRLITNYNGVDPLASETGELLDLVSGTRGYRKQRTELIMVFDTNIHNHKF